MKAWAAPQTDGSEGQQEEEAAAAATDQSPETDGDEVVERKVFLARDPSLDRQMPDPARVAQSRAQWAQHFAGSARAQQQVGGIAAAPDTLPAFPDARRVASKTGVQGGGGMRRRWKDAAGNIYEWDSQHGRVEKYDAGGKHQGEFDPNTGAQTKPKDKNRTVDP